MTTQVLAIIEAHYCPLYRVQRGIVLEQLKMESCVYTARRRKQWGFSDNCFVHKSEGTLWSVNLWHFYNLHSQKNSSFSTEKTKDEYWYHFRTIPPKCLWSSDYSSQQISHCILPSELFLFWETSEGTSFSFRRISSQTSPGKQTIEGKG